MAPLLALLVALGATPAAQKIAVMPIAAVEGVPGKTAEALTEAVSAEVRRRSGGQVITQREIAALLSLEQQKAMMGCQNDSCIAEIGGALGVDRMVAGDLSRLGESWLLHLKLLDPGKAQVLKASDRRLRGGTVDDLLDALPAMVAELFPPLALPTPRADRPAVQGGGTAVAATPGATTGAAASPAVTPAVVKLPGGVQLGGAEPPPPPEPLDAATAPMPPRNQARAVRSASLERSIAVPLALREEMSVFADERGRVLALAPFGGQGAPVFVGAPKKLFQQHVLARREEGSTAYSVQLWDPRAPDAVAVVRVSSEEARVACADREVVYQAVSRAKATKLLQAATYYAPPFTRQPVVLARDGEGNYFFVDAEREAGARGRDYHLYAGPQGALARVELSEVGAEGPATVLKTRGGRLRLAKDSAGRPKVDWLAGGGRRMLEPMDPALNQPLVFGDLGVYAGQALGGVCE